MLVPVNMHKAEKYALDKKALTDEGLIFLMQNCGCARKVYNLYVAWLYDKLEEANFQPGDTIDVKLPEVTAFKKRISLSERSRFPGTIERQDRFCQSHREVQRPG